MGITGSSRAASSAGAISATLLRFGMLAAGLAFTSWWVSHTILDVSRTQRVTHAVLADADFRNFLAEQISPIVTGTVPLTSLEPSIQAALAGSPTTAATVPAAVTGAASTETADQLNHRLADVLGQKDVEAQLEAFVVDVHRGLLGRTDQPAVLSQPTVVAIVSAAVPTLPPAELAQLHELSVNPPKLGVLSTTRRFLEDKFGLIVAVAALLITAAIALSSNRRASLATVGRWLIGISMFHLLFLWVIPVLIVPAVTSSPWAALIAAVARALSAGLLTGLVVLFLAGLGILVGDRFVGSPQDVGTPPG